MPPYTDPISENSESSAPKSVFDSAAHLPEIGGDTITFSEETVAFGTAAPEMRIDGKFAVQMSYTLKQEIARGGMGKIFTAEDQNLNREIALKVSTVITKSEDAKFKNEAEVLAHLEHPNIVPIHSMGTDSHGRSFYSMKLVKGRSLKTILNQLRDANPEALAYYTLTRLLGIFQKACNAVAFAHSKGYLHRDLKPENVMIGEFGELLVMDWGLAQSIKKGPVSSLVSVPAKAGKEEFHYVEGTPQYMSPEQAYGLELDERSDIYALGAILYTILTLQPPVKGENIAEILTKVRKGEVEPFAEQNHLLAKTTSGNGLAYVPTALRAVTSKAMSLKVEDRYASVEDLRRDIEAFLNGFATHAEQAGLGRQILLFIRRHQLVSIVILLSMIGATTTFIRLAHSEQTARNNAIQAQEQAELAANNARRAEDNARKAEDNARQAEDNARQAEDNALRAEALARIASANEATARKEVAAARRSAAEMQIAQAEAAEQDSNSEEMLRHLKGIPPDLRNQTWRYLDHSLNTADLTVEVKDNSSWALFAPHPLKPGALFTLQYNGWVRTVDLETGATEDILKLEKSGLKFKTFAVSPDAQSLAVLRDPPQDTERDRLTAQIEIHSIEGSNKKMEMAVRIGMGDLDMKFSPDGSLLLLTCRTGMGSGPTLQMFRTDTGAPVWKRNGEIDCFSDFSKDGNAVHLFSRKSGITKLNSGTGAEIKSSAETKFPDPVSTGYRITQLSNWKNVAYLNGNTCRSVDSESGDVKFEVRLNAVSTKDAQIDTIPTENLLVTLSPTSDNSAVVQFWTADNGSLIRSIPVLLEKRTGREWTLATHPGSSHLAVARGRSIKVWKMNTARGSTVLTLRKARNRESFSFLDQGWKILREVLTPRSKTEEKVKQVEILDTRNPDSKQTQRVKLLEGGSSEEHFSVSTSSNGLLTSVAWTKGPKPTLHLFSTSEDHFNEILSLPLPSEPVQPLRFQISPKGSMIWTEGYVYNAASGELLTELDRKELELPSSREDAAVLWIGEERFAEIAMAPHAEADGATKSMERSILLWNSKAKWARSATEAAPFADALAAAPDGSQIAEAGKDMRVRIRNGTTLAVERVLRVHDAAVLDVAWHPSLPLLATTSEDRTVRIWDLNSDTMVEEFSTFTDIPANVYWSPDGSTLAVRTNGARDNLHLFNPKKCQPAQK